MSAACCAGSITLGQGVQMVMPGDNAALAIEERARFAIREGNKTVGAGIITRILE